ncbi:MAG: universal stress protein [Pseudomonadales bacterium]
MAYKHILVAINLEEPSDTVLSRAIEMTEQHGARLAIISVLPQVDSFLSGMELLHSKEIVHSITRDGLWQLKSYLKQRLPQSLEGRTEIRAFAGSPETSITSYAASHDCDLIIVGAHDRHGLEYFLGTTASAVLYRAHCDVLGIRDKNNIHPYQTVVVAVDGGEQTAAILDKAASVADQNKNRQVVTILRPLILDYQLEQIDWSAAQISNMTGDLERAMIGKIQQQIDASPLAGLQLQTRSGKPSAQLKQFATEMEADLVIMGSGSRHGSGWMIGSTTHNVLHGVNCDVLVIRQSQRQVN